MEYRDLYKLEEYAKISDSGHIVTKDRITSNNIPVKSRQLKVYKNKNGYYYSILTINGKHKKCYLHRAVYQSFVAGVDSSMHVDHIDNNKKNNNIKNLQVLTPRENKAKQCFDKNGSCGVRIKNGKYTVRKYFNGKVYSIGGYSSLNEAQDVYNKADLSFCLEFKNKRENKRSCSTKYVSKNKYGKFIACKNGKYLGSFDKEIHAKEATASI